MARPEPDTLSDNNYDVVKKENDDKTGLKPSSCLAPHMD